MLAAKARRNRSLLEWIVERRLRLEEIAHAEHERGYEFAQEHRAGGEIESHGALLCGKAGVPPVSWR